jgi:hypothetical protein
MLRAGALPEIERSPEARARAEQALVRLLSGLEGSESDLIVLGGLVPGVLSSGLEVEAPAHLGTTDVDLLIGTQLAGAENLQAIERQLGEMKFSADPEGWQWRGKVDGITVKIEFLCDSATDSKGSTEIPGCEKLHACNLRGTGYVARDWSWQTLRGTLASGEELKVRAKFAGLSGYLLSKCAAARDRDLEKDYYDLVFVLRHNTAGGPTEAGRRLRHGSLADALPEMNSTMREIGGRFQGHGDRAVQSYASQMLRVEPELDEATLRADAIVAVAEFLDALEI